MSASEWAAWVQAGSAVLTLLAALVAVKAAYEAPRLAAEFSERLRAEADVRDAKLDCLRRVIAFRGTPVSRDWAAALNEIPVTFTASPEVMRSMVSLQRAVIERPGATETDILELIKAMLDDLGIDRSRLDDRFLLAPIAAQAA